MHSLYRRRQNININAECGSSAQTYAKAISMLGADVSCALLLRFLRDLNPVAGHPSASQKAHLQSKASNGHETQGTFCPQHCGRRGGPCCLQSRTRGASNALQVVTLAISDEQAAAKNASGKRCLFDTSCGPHVTHRLAISGQV